MANGTSEVSRPCRVITPSGTVLSAEHPVVKPPIAAFQYLGRHGCTDPGRHFHTIATNLVFSTRAKLTLCAVLQSSGAFVLTLFQECSGLKRPVSYQSDRPVRVRRKVSGVLRQFRTMVAAAAGLLLVPFASADTSERGHDIAVMGFVENVYIGKLGLEMKGKLDTGADSSSVFARDVHIYKKNGRDNWVRFRLIGKNGRTVRFDQNVRRFALIKKKNGGNIRRPVIHLPICIGGVRGLAEVNLADREDFEYDVLIGREFLASRVLVDSSSMFIADGECEVENRE